MNSGGFLEGSLGRGGPAVHRLGLSATYRPGGKTIFRALDEGLNYFFWFGFDTQMTSALRDLAARDRERCIIATGAYNWIWLRQDLRKTLEKRLKQLRTDYIDVFHFLGVLRGKEFPQRLQDQLHALKAEGLIRAVSVSTHSLLFAGELAARGAMDAMMIRYNAAYREAEQAVFPYLKTHRPGVIGFTATRWGRLLRRPRRWAKSMPVPTAGQCYRFVLSNPNIDVCLTAPMNEKQFDENLRAVRMGPLPEDEMEFMRDFGDALRGVVRPKALSVAR